MPEDLVSVRYMVGDVDAAIDFSTSHLGFRRPGAQRRRPPRSSGCSARP